MGKSRAQARGLERKRSFSSDETLSLGREIGRRLKTWKEGQPSKAAIVALMGEIGAGKTTLIKGIVSGSTRIPEEEVQSPTFAYLNIYGGEVSIYHFDLYRIQDPHLFFEMGFQEYLMREGICCIEWAERLLPHLPMRVVRIAIDHLTPQEREIAVEWPE